MASLSSKKHSNGKRTIVFFHPDLGIGGAERLVIDAAIGLQNAGNRVIIFTSHCDPTHCFDEARDGTLDVRVRGNTIVPPTLLGRFSILCAILRQFHLLLQISILSKELYNLSPTVFFVDQLSAINVFLRLLIPSARILFYCHFPDKLLAQRSSTIKHLYRVPFDLFESFTTGLADEIVVNSGFTKGIFAQAFPGLRDRKPAIVYPCVDVEEALKGVKDSSLDNTHNTWRTDLWAGKKVILSINRFERKKDVGLAIRAFAGLSKEVRQKTRLVIAGGYDVRVAENVNYHKELITLAESLNLSIATSQNLITALSIPAEVDVLFLLSVTSSLKSTLLNAAHLLAYTPGFEHFGIVPLEAMLARVPVIAANTGGPTETVVDSESNTTPRTGWLRPVNAVEQWTEVMHQVLEVMRTKDLEQVGNAGRQRAIKNFSKEKMAERLEQEIDGMMKRDSRPELLGPVAVGIFMAASVLSVMGVAFLLNWYLRARLRSSRP